MTYEQAVRYINDQTAQGLRVSVRKHYDHVWFSLSSGIQLRILKSSDPVAVNEMYSALVQYIEAMQKRTANV